MANSFKPSNALIDLMLNYEKFSANAYQKNDVPTIGYGHTGPDVYVGMPPITKPQARALFELDLQDKVIAVNNLEAKLTQNQFDAFVDLAFNAGKGLFIESSKAATSILTEINAGNFSNVPRVMAMYVISNGSVNNGLIQRRYDDVNIFS